MANALNASAKRKKAKTATAKKLPKRDQTLPGLEDTRDAILDDCCANLSSIRAKINALKADDAAEMQTALTRMQHKTAKHPSGRFSYRGSGVELARVSGEEKLRVRTSSEKATADAE